MGHGENEEREKGREGGREGRTYLGKGRVLLQVTVGDGTTGIADGVLEVPGKDLGLGHLRGGREGGREGRREGGVHERGVIEESVTKQACTDSFYPDDNKTPTPPINPPLPPSLSPSLPTSSMASSSMAPSPASARSLSRSISRWISSRMARREVSGGR